MLGFRATGIPEHSHVSVGTFWGERNKGLRGVFSRVTERFANVSPTLVGWVYVECWGLEPPALPNIAMGASGLYGVSETEGSDGYFHG